MARYYKFEPVGFGAGLFTTPYLGEVEVGHTYEVPDELADIFDGSPDWVAGRKSDIDTADAEKE